MCGYAFTFTTKIWARSPQLLILLFFENTAAVSGVAKLYLIPKNYA